jgi:anaerobic magnesium-protoporphyrin IX monomethyl ester cyclase
MTAVAVEALARAGCREVWLGAESGSQRVLDAMDKGIRVEQVAEATRRLRAAGIRACWFLQFGFPGETFEDVLATVEMVREGLPDDVGVSVSYPLPGTRFFELVEAELGEKTHWQDSNDLAMMFQGTYQTPFYRKLRQVVHRELDLRQRLARGEGGEALLGDLDRVAADWLELGRLEAGARSAAPTVIGIGDGSDGGSSALPAPDLSRAWN